MRLDSLAFLPLKCVAFIHIQKSVLMRWSLKTKTQGFITMALYTSSNHPIKITLKTELHSIYKQLSTAHNGKYPFKDAKRQVS